jgi:hypothetical protein
LQESSQSFRQLFLHSSLSVLWEKASPANGHMWELSGLSDNYLRVRSFFPSPCRNQIMNVSISAIEAEGLFGEIQPS